MSRQGSAFLLFSCSLMLLHALIPKRGTALVPSASEDASRDKALNYATARRQILELPVLSDWKIPPAYAERFEHSDAKPRAAASHPANVWFAIGPQPIAVDPSAVWGAKNAHETGRIISIASTGGDSIYAGGEFGGLWEYSRNGKRWRPLTDNQISPQIGAIAIDPAHPQTVFAGTGANNSVAVCGTGVFAQGVLKSVNGGKWELLGQETLAGAGISRILIGEGNDAPILLATSAGVFRSTDGGNSWKKTYSGCVHDMAISPASPSTFYASTNAGLTRSTDNGLTWTADGINQPSLPQDFKIQHFLIAASRAKARADVLYASVTSAGCQKWAAFRSPDGGKSWSNIGSPPNLSTGFCAIGLALSLAADPLDPDVAIFGGGWLYAYNAKSKKWKQFEITAVAHSDMRALAFDPQGHLYVGNDGGVWEVPDPANMRAGTSFNDGGLQVTEFQSGLSVSPDGLELMAGSQDNGIEIYRGNIVWASPLGADGGATAIDQNDSPHMFAEGTFPPSLQEKPSRGGWGDVQLPAECSAGRLAISPALPSRPPSPAALYLGGKTICKYSASRVGGPMAWTKLTQACPKPGSNGCGASAIALQVDPLHPAHVFVGWSNSTVNFSSDAGKTWKTATRQPITGIAAIAVSPDNPFTIAVLTRSGHVWLGTNVNSDSPVWSDDTGNLPVVDGLWGHAILYSAGGLIVASDAGVFGQAGGAGQPWAVLGKGLPNTRVMDLHWVPWGLVAVTYGRGAWEITAP